MDFGEFKPRVNAPVAGGPVGLDSWCVVYSDPTGVLVKPAGTRAYLLTGGQAWDNVDGTAAGWIPVTGYDAAEVSGTTGVGGLAAGQVVRFDAGTGTFLPARADAVATGRGVVGVVSVASAAGAPAVAYSLGVRRVLAAASCVPVRGNEVYLSRVTAGSVTSVLDGSTYPVMVGYFDESAVGLDGRIAVRLVIDQARDDARLWHLSHDVVAVAASSLTYPLVRALWSEVVVECSNIGALAQSAIDYPADVSQAFQASGAAVVNVSYYPNDAGVLTGISSTVSGSSYYLLTDRRVASAVWVAKHECWAMNKSSAGVRRYGNSRKTNPADSVVLNGGANLVFPVGAVVEIDCRRAAA